MERSSTHCAKPKSSLNNGASNITPVVHTPPWAIDHPLPRPGVSFYSRLRPGLMPYEKLSLPLVQKIGLVRRRGYDEQLWRKVCCGVKALRKRSSSANPSSVLQPPELKARFSLLFARMFHDMYPIHGTIRASYLSESLFLNVKLGIKQIEDVESFRIGWFARSLESIGLAVIAFF